MDKITFSKDLKKKSDEKKNYNIQAFANLDRTSLEFGKVERRVLIEEYTTGEKLYIQYPGKETVIRGTRGARPWDFRPKMLLDNNNWLIDMSFKDIWDDLYAFKGLQIDMSYLATIFFRMAYMLDTVKVDEELSYQDISADGKIVNEGTLNLSWYKYNPSSDLFEKFIIPKEAIRNVSLLPYLAYNDFLAQNEDCKYYYRAVYEKNEKWKTDTGRRNTLLTHASVIAFIEEQLKFTEITDMFQRGLGVAPLGKKYWQQVTNNRVN